MLNWYVFALYLYFPDDKSEYIPAAIKLIVFLIGAIVFMRFIIVVSRRQEKKAKELEEKIIQANKKEEENS